MTQGPASVPGTRRGLGLYAQAWDSDGTATVSSEAEIREQLHDLDLRRAELDRRIADAVNRQRYEKDKARIDAAKRDEQSLLVEMDRLMTRIRAVEGKILQLRRSR
jgi:hypothetical protein